MVIDNVPELVIAACALPPVITPLFVMLLSVLSPNVDMADPELYVLLIVPLLLIVVVVGEPTIPFAILIAGRLILLVIVPAFVMDPLAVLAATSMAEPPLLEI